MATSRIKPKDEVTEDENIEEIGTDIEPGQELTDEDKAVWLMGEKDLLQALIAAGDYKSSEDMIRNIEIERGGKVMLAFRVGPIDEKDWVRIRKENTKRYKSKQTGLMTNGEMDAVRYRSQIIYEATVEADRTKVWDNKAAWSHFNVVTGIDMIDAILLPGEKQRVFEVIDDLNGYADEDQKENELIEVTKN